MIGNQLIHTIEIQRAAEGAADDYGQPGRTFAALATVQGLIQPKSGRERAQVNEAGAVRGDYRVFLFPTDVAEGDQLVCADSGVAGTYQIGFVANAGGQNHHLELDCSRVRA